jgi:hypothetical protein
MSTTRWCTLCWLLLVPFSVEAAEMAKQGTDSYTITYVVTSSHTMKLADRTYTVIEFGGISRNDKGSGMFHNMGVRCLGTREAVGGEAVNRGVCTDMDKDGDQVFSTYESRGNPGAGIPFAGAHIYVGGTGKYTGFSGKADYTVEPVKDPDNMPMLVVPHKATWKIP